MSCRWEVVLGVKVILKLAWLIAWTEILLMVGCATADNAINRKVAMVFFMVLECVGQANVRADQVE